EVRRAVAQTPYDADRNRVAASRGELVDVERHRLARLRRGLEVRKQRPVVEREVRRADHRDGIGAEIGGMSSELDGLACRLGAAVDGDRELLRPSRQEELRGAAALRGAEQDSLPSRTEREQPVETAGLEERDERVEGVFVQQFAATGKRRDSGSE